MIGWELLVSTRVAADLFAGLFLKASVVVALAAVAARVLRDRPAEVRHWLWLGALVACAALPVADMLQVGASRTDTAFHYPAETALVGVEAIRLAAPAAGADEGAAGSAAAETVPGAPTSLPLLTLFLIVWWVGVVGGGTRLLADLVRVMAVRARGIRASEEHPAARLLRREADRSGISQPVALLLFDEQGLAATLGVLRPAILLGHDVAGLPDEELRPVLLHELAHIQRHDFVTNLLARAALVIGWMNPLTWWLGGHAERDRERACDDAVIRAGIPAPQYANVLLAFAATTPSLSPAMRSSVRLRLSATKARLDSVLDTRTDRRASGPGAALPVLTAFALVVLALGSVDLLSATPGNGTTTELIASLGSDHPDVRARAARTLTRRGPAPARVELERLLDDPDSDVRLAAASALEQLADPASLPALARVLERPYDDGRGEHGFVLKLAMLTVGAIGGDEAYALLEAQLTRPVAPLRWLALETMMAMPTHADRTRAHLAAFAASDPAERSRRLASEALAGR